MKKINCKTSPAANSAIDNKIDLVYLWVDGNDKKWRARKDAALASSGRKAASDRVSASRFFDNDELKYSLRSAEKFAPWINHIFIVTDEQTPKWLDTKNPRISIIDHKQILPKNKLPTFNPNVLEAAVPNILGLSEYFLLANDDTFFGNQVTRSYFFSKDGTPIILAKKAQLDARSPDSYTGMIIGAKSLIRSIYGDNHNYNWAPSHNIDPYRKSFMLAALSHPKIKHAADTNGTFGSALDLQRTIFHEYFLANNLAAIKIFSKLKRLWLRLIGKYGDFPQYVSHAAKLEKMRKRGRMPKLFCINNSGKDPVRDTYNHKFLETFLPNKSEFEK